MTVLVTVPFVRVTSPQTEVNATFIDVESLQVAAKDPAVGQLQPAVQATPVGVKLQLTWLILFKI